MTLTLYYDPLSSPSRAVLSLLNLAKIPFEKHIISVFKGEAKSPEYLKINPLGLVPALDDNGFIVFEHEAILRYLVNKYKEAQAFFPSDAKIQGLVDQYYPFHHYSVRRIGAQYFVGYHKLFGVESFDDKEAVGKELDNVLSQFDSIFLKDKKYIAGDSLTIADLTAATEFFQLFMSTDVDSNKVPRVKAYVEKVFESPIIKEVHQPFLEHIGKTYK